MAIQKTASQRPRLRADNPGAGFPPQTPPLESKEQRFRGQRDSVQRYSLTAFG
jgi:hypothetical protein